MILKSVLRDNLREVLTDHDTEDDDLLESLVDRMTSVTEVMDDEDEATEGLDQEEGQ